MDDILFKIPMKPEHFKTWVEAPLRKAAGRNAIDVAARGIKNGRILGLFAYFYDLKDGAYLRFRNKPQKSEADGENCESDIYCRTNSFSETIALFEDLFLRGTPPNGKGWLPKDGTIERIADACGMRALINSTADSLRALATNSPTHALQALKARDLKALDAVFDSGIEPSECRVPESRAKKARDIPVLARYFKETKSLSFAVEAIKLLARRGYRLKEPWIGSDTDVRRFNRLGYDLAEALLLACGRNPLGYGAAEARALARHCDDPQFLATWKALLDTELPFVQEKGEVLCWLPRIEEAFSEACTELRNKGRSQGLEKLFLAGTALRYLILGLPHAELSDLSLVSGRRLSRVLLAPIPGHKLKAYAWPRDVSVLGDMEQTGCIILDFEDVYVTVQGGGIACTDPHALENFPNSVDKSELFEEVIGKRVLDIQFTCKETTKNSYEKRQAFVFNDGTFLIASAGRANNKLTVLERSWGTFKVTSNGVLEHQYWHSLLFSDIYGTEFWHHEDKERLLEIAMSNPLFDAYLDGAYDEWIWTRRQSTDFHSWKNVIAWGKNKNSLTAIWKLVGRWLESPVPESDLARKMLPCTHATDRGLAAHELEDMPEVFARELGLVWPNPEDHYAVECYAEGIRLTKSIDEANAVAKERGWRISFQPDPTSLREALVSDPDLTPSQH